MFPKCLHPPCVFTIDLEIQKLYLMRAEMVGAVVRSMLSDQNVRSSIHALPRFESCVTFFSA